MNKHIRRWPLERMTEAVLDAAKVTRWRAIRLLLCKVADTLNFVRILILYLHKASRPFGKILMRQRRTMKAVEKNADVLTAPVGGERLDRLADLYGLKRAAGESDEDLRSRILRNFPGRA